MHAKPDIIDTAMKLIPASIFTIAALALAPLSASAQQPKPAPDNAVKPAGPGKGLPKKPIGTIVPPPAGAASQAGPARAPAELAREPIIRTNALVKVNATSQSYKLHIPWQKESPGARRGLGVVIEGNRILVTGQLVADSTYIELELPESGQKMPAKVVAVDYEANVALLASAAPAKEKEFFSTLKPMALDTSSRIGTKLAVWQIGRVGDLIATQMTLSKVMTQGYVVDNASFLVYEAIGTVRSEGNSFTLPLVKGGRLAGLLLRYDSKNTTATFVPAPIIEHFLKDTADGKYDGFPSLGIEMAQTLDEQFRDFLGMKSGMKGAYVSGVSKGASAEKIGIKQGDIILSINDNAVDSRGDYQDPQYGALSISHIVRGRAFIGDKVDVKVLREGKELALSGRLLRKQPSDYLVTPYLFDRGTNYVMMGGLLFQELSKPYLQAFGSDQQSGSLLRLARIADHPDDYEKAGRKKLVFLSAVLPTPSVQGYERLGGLVVDAVNGRKINDLLDLDAAFKEPKDGIHVIELADFPRLLYLDAISAERDNLKLVGGAYRMGSLKRIE